MKITFLPDYGRDSPGIRVPYHPTASIQWNEDGGFVLHYTENVTLVYEIEMLLHTQPEI